MQFLLYNICVHDVLHDFIFDSKRVVKFLQNVNGGIVGGNSPLLKRQKNSTIKHTDELKISSRPASKSEKNSATRNSKSLKISNKEKSIERNTQKSIPFVELATNSTTGRREKHKLSPEYQEPEVIAKPVIAEPEVIAEPVIAEPEILTEEEKQEELYSYFLNGVLEYIAPTAIFAFYEYLEELKDTNTAINDKKKESSIFKKISKTSPFITDLLDYFKVIFYRDFDLQLIAISYKIGTSDKIGNFFLQAFCTNSIVYITNYVKENFKSDNERFKSLLSQEVKYQKLKIKEEDSAITGGAALTTIQFKNKFKTMIESFYTAFIGAIPNPAGDDTLFHKDIRYTNTSTADEQLYNEVTTNHHGNLSTYSWNPQGANIPGIKTVIDNSSRLHSKAGNFNNVTFRTSTVCPLSSIIDGMSRCRWSNTPIATNNVTGKYGNRLEGNVLNVKVRNNSETYSYKAIIRRTNPPSSLAMNVRLTINIRAPGPLLFNYETDLTNVSNTNDLNAGIVFSKFLDRLTGMAGAIPANPAPKSIFNKVRNVSVDDQRELYGILLCKGLGDVSQELNALSKRRGYGGVYQDDKTTIYLTGDRVSLSRYLVILNNATSTTINPKAYGARSIDTVQELYARRRTPESGQPRTYGGKRRNAKSKKRRNTTTKKRKRKTKKRR